MIRVGQLGIGHNHGAAKMKALRKFPNLFQVVGFAPESEEWFEKRGQNPAYEGIPRLTVEELLEKCDAVLVETEVSILTESAQKCIDAGKHILMDKPASGTLADFRRLLDCAKAKNLVLQIGYMYRYNPAVLKCIDLFEKGKLGEIYSIQAQMSACDPEGYKKWLETFPGGGMYIFGSHLLDLVIRFLGRPEKVTGFFCATGKDGLESPDQSLAVLEYPKAMAQIFTSAVEVNGYGRRQFVVSGSRGTVSILPMECPCRMTYSDLEIATHHHRDFKEEAEIEELTRDQRYDLELGEFHDYITGIKENPWTYEHNFLVQEILTEIVGGTK